MFLDKGNYSGYLNFNSKQECIDFLRKRRAREFFADNPDEKVYSVALINFDSREHLILEFEVETKINVLEY